MTINLIDHIGHTIAEHPFLSLVVGIGVPVVSVILGFRAYDFLRGRHFDKKHEENVKNIMINQPGMR